MSQNVKKDEIKTGAQGGTQGGNDQKNREANANNNTKKAALKKDESASPAAGAASTSTGAKKAHRLPPLKGQSRGGGRAAGIKPLLLALFATPYAKWQGFGSRIANGMYKNHWVPGSKMVVDLEKGKDDRLWVIVNVAKDGTETQQGEPMAYSKIKDMAITASQVKRPHLTIEEMPLIASHRQFGKIDGNSPYGADVHGTSDGTAEGTPLDKPAYDTLQKYDGWVGGTTENAEKIVNNVREFYGNNPEIPLVFEELPTWESIYGQPEVKAMVNAEYEIAEEDIKA